MDKDIVIKVIMQKGLKNIELSMFSDDERKGILEKVAENLIRQGKTNEIIEILEQVDTKKFADIMGRIADQCMDMEEYEKAAFIYDRIGDHLLAEVVRKNFL
jgi:hypothetical protein